MEAGAAIGCHGPETEIGMEEDIGLDVQQRKKEMRALRPEKSLSSQPDGIGP